MAEIEVRGQTKTFGRVTAVRGLSLRRRQGRTPASSGPTAGELRFTGPLHELGETSNTLESAFLRLTVAPT